MSKFFDVIPFLSMILILVYAYYVYVIELCHIMITLLFKKIIYLIFFHIIFITFFVMCFITSCHKSWTVPDQYWFSTDFFGKVKAAKTPEQEYALILNFCKERRIKVFTRTSTGGFRFCDICQLLKPDRTHHCSKCNSCVLRMDHHCPWLNNCIGFTNHKYFMVTVLYGIIYCFYYFGTTIEYVTYFFGNSKWQDNLRSINVVITCFLTLIIGVAIMFLLYYQLRSICDNETTLESLHTPTFSSLYPVTFTRGACTNFKDFCGTNPGLWCLPINTFRGDGTTFEIERDVE